MKIYLTPVTLSDSKMIVKWRNSDNVRSHCFDNRLITEESNKKFFEQYVATGKYKQFIVNKIDDDFGVISYAIASIYLKDIDIVNARCELCIFTSDDGEWNDESRAIAIKMMLHKAFCEYGIEKVYSYVFSKNEDEINLLERAGFEKEAFLKKEAVDLSGKRVDVVRMGVLKGGFNE